MSEFRSLEFLAKVLILIATTSSSRGRDKNSTKINIFCLARHDGKRPPDWTALDQTDGGKIDLGRWNHDGHALLSIALKSSDQQAEITADKKTAVLPSRSSEISQKDSSETHDPRYDSHSPLEFGTDVTSPRGINPSASATIPPKVSNIKRVSVKCPDPNRIMTFDFTNKTIDARGEQNAHIFDGAKEPLVIMSGMYYEGNISLKIEGSQFIFEERFRLAGVQGEDLFAVYTVFDSEDNTYIKGTRTLNGFYKLPPKSGDGAALGMLLKQKMTQEGTEFCERVR
jgi:hypothetical protein